MRRIGSKISALSFVAAFLATSAVDALGLHRCPHHDALTPVGAAGRVHAGNAAEAYHPDAHPGIGAHEDDGSGHDEHGGPCTCVGTCQADGSSPLGVLGPATEQTSPTPSGDAALASVAVVTLPGAPHLQAPAQVAVGPAGEVYVVWTNNTPVPGRRFPASDLRLARSADGGRSFGPALTVNDDAGGAPTSHTFHDVSVAASGGVIVSWLDGRGEADDGPAGGLGQGEDAGPDVRVAVSTDGGRVVMAWLEGERVLARTGPGS